MKFANIPVISTSVVSRLDTSYALAYTAVAGDKKLVVSGDVAGFDGKWHTDNDVFVCPLNADNATELRRRLPLLIPVALGTNTSAGFGDRLGCATVGHLLATNKTDVMPILAQQSVRENERTGRTPQQVMDDAMWGVFELGWQKPWGADADHLKLLDDIPAFVDAGYTFFTIDPGAYVDDLADKHDEETLLIRAKSLDWTTLETSFDAFVFRMSDEVSSDDIVLNLDKDNLLRAIVKYGNAIAHTVKMARRIRELMGTRPFDLEMSVDETGTTTSHIEHFVIVNELKRLGIDFVSIAPRFVGRFEKGVDYIGDLAELEQDIAGHAAIMKHFDNTYKLSLHTGSDKFGVYPLAVKYTSGRVHLKTAGTSYLEALRVIAQFDAPLFREILEYARGRYEIDRKTYHVSASIETVPNAFTLHNEQLPDLLDQFDARQVLHVTYGSILDKFGQNLLQVLKLNQDAYQQGLEKHFDRHLESFKAVKYAE